jgi:glycosyltransferase involved in cell wall biosynthesis
MWPDSVFATDFLTRGVSRRLAERSLTWFTQKAYQGASHVAVTTPGMRDLLLERGVPGDKVSTVFNWVDEKLMQPTEPDRELRARLGLAGKFVLMYAGNHGPAQALDVAIKAMSEVRDLPDLQLVLIGDGIDKPALRQLARELELQSVHFVDTVEAERVPALMASADLQLVSLADRPLFRITLPSKVQSILACGQPVLCSAAGDAARVIAEAGAGLVAPPGDPVMLAQVLREAHRMPRTRLRDMGEAGRDYYRSTLSEEVNAGALASLLGSAARQGRGVGRA